MDVLQFLKDYWAIFAGTISFVVGYTKLNQKMRSAWYEINEVKDRLKEVAKETSYYSETKLRVEKVEKYCGELYERTGTLEKESAAQNEINKNVTENFNWMRNKLEKIEELIIKMGRN